MKLFIDDLRYPPNDDWIIARTYDEAIKILETGLVSEISFDHDLGNENVVSEKSGYDIVCWIEQKLFTGEWTFIPKMSVHSMNPVGRRNIQMVIDTINRFMPERMEELGL